MTSTFVPETVTAASITGDGTVEAFVAVTGVVDEVGDVIVPGAFRRTLGRLLPKGADAHDWKTPIARTLSIRELRPGDPALPERTADGQPWPREAGALWVRGRFNLATKAGSNAYANAKFFGSEQSYSIGYRVVPGGSTKRNGVRYIRDLDLFEWSPVLHGANRYTQQIAVKSGLPDGVEVKALALSPGRRRTSRATAVITPAELSAAARLAAESEDTWAEINAADIQYVLDAGARLQALPNGTDEDQWEAIPCAACGSTAAHVRGGLPEGSGAICLNCAPTTVPRT